MRAKDPSSSMCRFSARAVTASALRSSLRSLVLQDCLDRFAFCNSAIHPFAMPTSLTIPADQDNALMSVDGKEVRLTNLRKIFWPQLGLTKGDLIQYYADVAPVLLPHIRDRAMVMKRYPHGAGGEFFFMKRAPVPRPEWIRTCSIEHESGNIIDFPVIDDVPSLLWVINLGCIDLNQWYATCDDVDRPDYVHFDLDPGDGATWERVLECGRIVHDALDTLQMPSVVK